MSTVGREPVGEHVTKLCSVHICWGICKDLHQVYATPLQCKVARGTQVSIGTFARENYFSH
jgi:hypothetical protein